MKRRKGGMKKSCVKDLNKIFNRWLVTMPDGRRAEVVAINRLRAAEQASMVWGVPAAWLLEHAKIIVAM